MPAEPKADKIPIKMPFPVDPALILITTDDMLDLPGSSVDCRPEPWSSIMVEVAGKVVDDIESEGEAVRVKGTMDDPNE
jgi:hypothetical protein